MQALSITTDTFFCITSEGVFLYVISFLHASSNLFSFWCNRNVYLSDFVYVRRKKETQIFSLYSLPQKGQNFVGWFNADVTSSY